MDKTDSLEQAEQLRHCVQTIADIYGVYAKAWGLSYMSFRVLEIIYHSPNRCTQKHICERSLYTKQTVNMIVASFWRQGYVRLEEIAADRRNKQIRLTEKGRAHAEKLFQPLWELEQAVLNTLSETQRNGFVSLTQLCTQRMRDEFDRALVEKGEPL